MSGTMRRGINDLSREDDERRGAQNERNLVENECCCVFIIRKCARCDINRG